jgi:hypothetical protein
LESINTFCDLTVSNSFSKDFFHLVFLFFLSLFRVSSDLPFLNILMPRSKLKGVNFRTDVSQLLENWHNDKLDETSVTLHACDISTSLRPFDLSTQWADLLFDEFFN